MAVRGNSKLTSIRATGEQLVAIGTEKYLVNPVSPIQKLMKSDST